MIKQGWLALLLCPLLAQATPGSWSVSVGGGAALSRGGQTIRSAPLTPSGAIPPGAQLRRYQWQIRLLSPPPADLILRLCSAGRCVPLPALRGTGDALRAAPASGPFYFEYTVRTPSRLLPPVQVVSQQLTVNYH